MKKVLVPTHLKNRRRTPHSLLVPREYLFLSSNVPSENHTFCQYRISGYFVDLRRMAFCGKELR
jgi:hypothetical protein